MERNKSYDGPMGIFEGYGEADEAHAAETVTKFIKHPEKTPHFNAGDESGS
jgi:isoaspartyl peptidase/L-asparaginase-like protein (Ntn-hydrolase superfamily)